MEFIIQIIGGLIGGNAAGAGAKNLSLGTAGNSIVGALGGLGLGQILSAMMSGGAVDATAAAATSGMGIGGIITQLLAGGVGGGVLTAVVGLIKSRMAK